MERLSTDEDLYARIRQAVSEVLAVSLEKVHRNSRFVEDLGADSLDKISLLLSFESETGLSISDEDASRIATINDLMNHIEKSKSAKS